jgi:sulfate adenylyltransferase large subunit
MATITNALSTKTSPTTARPTLRIATAGSVDDGKSTLIGRLLHDTKTVFEDQLAAVTKASRRYGDGSVNLALLTDGLRAEREQGITIDVAHRYVATPARNMIIADTPGHAQYTRNMVTGASTADVAIVLVDARNGVVEQTRRHALVASLLGVESIAIAVNKMDLVEWDQGQFDRIVKELVGFIDELPTRVPVVAFPISALHGDNVVARSANTPWFEGVSLLEFLEGFEASVTQGVARLDVQRVIRPAGSDFRGLAGRLADGSIEVGAAMTVQPAGRQVRVARLQRFGRDIDRAEPGQAITVVLDGDVDVARGDTLVAAPVPVTEEVRAHLCWMIDAPLRVGQRLWFRHGSRTGRATITALHALHGVGADGPLDDESADRAPAAPAEVVLNDLADVSISLSEPIAALPYVRSKAAGRMILIDEATNATAAAVMIVSAGPS